MICFVSLIFVYFICIKVSKKLKRKKKRYRVHTQSYRVGTDRNIYDDVLLCFHFENVFPISSHTHPIRGIRESITHRQTRTNWTRKGGTLRRESRLCKGRPFLQHYSHLSPAPAPDESILFNSTWLV